MEKKDAVEILRAIQIPGVLLDENWTILEANEKYQAKYNYQSADLTNQSIFKIHNEKWNFPELIYHQNLIDESLSNSFLIDFFDTQQLDIEKESCSISGKIFRSQSNSNNLILVQFLRKENSTELEGNKKTRYEELESFFLQAPAAMAIISGDEQQYTFFNSLYLKLFNRVGQNLMGKTVKEVFPEIEGQGIYEVFEKVYHTGEPFNANEFPAYFDRSGTGKNELGYFNFTAHPIRDKKNKVTDIFIHAVEVTEHVQANKKLEESETRYLDLIHSSPSMIAIFRGNSLIIDVANDSVLKMWSKGRDIIGKSIYDVLPEMVDQGIELVLKKVYNTGIPFDRVEVPFLFPRDERVETIYLNLSFYPQKNVKGEVLGIFLIASDVTLEAEYNNKIRESESQFRKMADLLPSKITNTDPDGNVIYFNKNWTTYTGMTLKELKKMKWREIVHPDDYLNFSLLWDKSLLTGENFEMEFRCLDKEQNYRSQLGRAIAIKKSNGKVEMWLSSVTDIQKIKEEEKRKEDFLKMVSHELKTPLTTIKGYTQLLLNNYCISGIFPKHWKYSYI